MIKLCHILHTPLILNAATIFFHNYNFTLYRQLQNQPTRRDVPRDAILARQFHSREFIPVTEKHTPNLCLWYCTHSPQMRT